MRLCACGCGNVTPIAKHGSRKFGFKAGEHCVYLKGHSQVKGYPPPDAEPPLCACGCRRPVNRYSRSRRSYGAIKGNFAKYLIGHVARKSSVIFAVEWRGHTSACWTWKMRKTDSGYGLKGSALAHKYWWEKVNGTIPVGLELDHLCSNRDCIRPDHMEPVTRSENMLRAFARRKERQASV